MFDMNARSWPVVAHAGKVSRRIVEIVLSVAILSGCEQKAPNYTPSTASATDAVRRALDAWKAGQPPGDLPGTPALFVTDAGRRPDQKLQSYEVLGESQGPTGRTIAVVLHLTNPDQELRTRYLVVGIDPLWVFRQEDYELLMHWDHYMPGQSVAIASETTPTNQDRAEAGAEQQTNPEGPPADAELPTNAE